MKKINTLFKVTMLSAMAIGAIGFAIQSNKSNSTVKAEAAQYLQDYAPYTYTGDYYDKINFSAGDGMNGALKSAIAKKAKPEAYYTYSGTGATTIAEQLQKADEDPNNSSNMIYLYTRNSVKKNAASSWNREHVWPQSCSNNNWGKTVGGVDILHLRPTYNDTNNERGNKKYGDLSDSYAVYYSSMLYGYSSSSYFEPIDQVKGDVAREIMYLWTVYDNSSKPLSITSVFQSYNLMLQWHTMDKPDVLEGNRNDYCEKKSKQKNRNPFVDHPELAWKIFGDQVSASVKSACQQAYPGNGGTPVGPVTPTSIVLDKEELTLNKNSTYTLHASLMPNGATGTISWSSDDDSIASVNSNGVVTANGVGIAVITASHNSLTAECLVEVVDGSSTQTGELEITDSISVGDTVYLTADDAKKQYDGPTTSGTIYGKGASYSEKPDTDGIGLIVRSGSNNGTYAFELDSGSNANKYLAWNSDKTLITSDTIDSNSSWSVTFDANKNARFENAADSERVIWWNVSSPRFACYTGKTAGDAFYSTQLWKAGSAPITDTYDFDESFAQFDSVASIHGTEHYNTTGGTYDVVFKDLGYGNQTDFDEEIIGDITITADISTGSNHPKYYTSGDALRMYTSNTLTITSASYNITEIDFTFSGSSAGMNNVIGNLDDGVWTGDASSVTFSFSSQVRIQRMVITYGTSVYDSVDDISLRFGGEIPKNAWDAVASHEEISDYGVMLVRKNTLVNTYKCSSIEEAFGLDKTLAVVSNGSGQAPFLSGNRYIFKANIKVSNYETEFCAAPFVVINDEYKFLTERTWSAKELAKEMLKVNISELCDDALRDIAGITE